MSDEIEIEGRADCYICGEKAEVITSTDSDEDGVVGNVIKYYSQTCKKKKCIDEDNRNFFAMEDAYRSPSMRF